MIYFIIVISIFFLFIIGLCAIFLHAYSIEIRELMYQKAQLKAKVEKLEALVSYYESKREGR